MNERDKARFIEILKTWMQSNEEALTAILDAKVSFSGSKMVENPERTLYAGAAGNLLAFPMTLAGVVSGTMYLVIQTDDLAVIIDMMIGGNGSAPMEELDDMHMIVFVQAIKQLAGSFSQILSENIGASIEVKADKPQGPSEGVLTGSGNAAVLFNLQVEPVLGTSIQLLIPVILIDDILNQSQDGGNSRVGGFNQEGLNPNAGQSGGSGALRKARFPSLGAEEKTEDAENIDIMMDIPLQLTVVLGKTGINLKDLVELKSGSIFALDKMAGEPVELYINDRFVGYGEVIVIDDNFGVRVIEVPSSAEAARGAGGGKRR
ncbi:MAG: flagellar motor switch protein FliN [Firmicutes bacterium]|nr:flagellar motor switch protein FliN [Bacillota bacterium]